MSIRVILSDDHQIIRDGLRSLLEKQPGIEVIAEAADGRTTVDLATKLKPDVIIMDVSMPDMNGIEATSRIIEKTPKIKVIALSMHSDRQFIIEMLNAGASGYILKDAAFSELINAIHAVMANRSYLSPEIAHIMIEEFKHILSKEKLSVFSILTPREREVLQLIAEGKTTKEIAFKLKVSVKTAETYRQNIMDKLDIHTIAGLTKYAVREGLTTLGE
ncbi:MAG: response regulator transcription factor [Nitrospira sp.]|nr:response regulator transcription factor [Nitrospira sp.]